MAERFSRVNFLLALGYTGSAILVLVYVNMFPVWKFFSSRWEPEAFIVIPVLASVGAVVAITGSFFLLQHHNRLSIHKLPIIIGLLLCLLGLLIPDPQFPVKRIHVAEYVLLSLVVRWTMSFRLQGMALLFFSACFAAMLGVHDELLQGLHPSRTYGLRDMAVNSLAGFGGAFIWHGLHLFKPEVLLVRQNETGVRLSSLFVGWLLTGVLAFILPLTLYRGGTIPCWPAMPLIGAIVLFSVNTEQFTESWKHGVGALSVISFALILYPLMTYGKAFSFY